MGHASVMQAGFRPLSCARVDPVNSIASASANGKPSGY